MAETTHRLPAPDGVAAAHSERLTERIVAELRELGGWMAFERYMERALHEPGLGYYSAGSVKLGPAGDFVTAPERGAFFARALAAQLIPWLAALEQPAVLELGAGSGSLAAEVLGRLEAHGLAAVPYRILEPSAELAARQRKALRPFGARVQWLERLPEASFEGVVLANEVVDALPVARFLRRGKAVVPLGVALRAGRFVWAEGPEQPALTAAVHALEKALGRRLEPGFETEICLRLPAWLAAVTEPLARGALLLIDYGMARHEYYHPDRHRGTLMCHYRHRAHGDPFFLPGLQDISAWVDFSACADAARAAGLDVSGYTTQGHFLLERAACAPDARAWERASPAEINAFKRLVLPGEMGERFKVILLTRALPRHVGLPGRDFRDRL